MKPLNFHPLAPRFGAAYQPKIGVIDDFGKKTVDIDGDQVPDLSHGETVTRFIKAQCPTAEIIRYNVAPPSAGTIALAKLPLRLLDCLKQAVDAVNLSYEIARAVPPRIESQNFYPEFVRDLRESDHPIDHSLAYILPILSEVAKAHRVYVAAGNSGEQTMNVLGTPPDVINVGATNALGRVASFSPRHARVSAYAQGIFAITKVKGGFDLTGDGRADVLDHEVSGGKPFLADFSQKPLSQVCANTQELTGVQAQAETGKAPEGIPLLHQRLFKLEDLQAMGLMGEAEYEQNRQLGDYAVLDLLGTWHVFSETDGKALYQPDGSNRHHAVYRTEGTSFSAPFKLGADLQRLVKAKASGAA